MSRFPRSQRPYGWVQTYSKTSIARARIARMPDRSNTLADSMFRSFAILNSCYCCGAIFTSQNRPKCEFNSHFERFRLVKMAPTTSSYRSLTVGSDNHFLQFRPKWGERVNGTFSKEFLLSFDNKNISFVDRFCLFPSFQAILHKIPS